MTRYAKWTLLILLAVAGWAQADRVYMLSGTTYDGRVSRDGDTVRVETADGKTIELPASEVLTIAEGVGDTGETTTQEAESAPSEPAAADDATTASAPALGRLELAEIERPEPFVFFQMRRLQSPGVGSYQARQQLKRWQVLAHDQQRRCDGRWYGPEEFQRRRQKFISTVAEAETLLRESRPRTGRRGQEDPRERADRIRKRAEAMQKLVMAAKTWADPLLSRYLTGLAQYHSGDYRAAEVLFANCRREAPRVAGFAQAHGMAMLERGRELESIEAFMAALKLQPESQEAVTNLRAALERVPGAQIKRAEYTLAVEALEGYPAAPIGRDSRRRTSLPTFSLLMPGGPWTVRDESLPIPTYDRLTFKQAAGVAIGEGTLLIDMDALEGAQEIFVKVGDQLVPAELPRAMRRRTGDAPVAAVEVPNVQFKPVGVLEDDEKFEAETDVVIHAMNVFESMDSEIRKVPAKISKVDEDNAITLSAALAPGESGAPVITSDGKLAGFVAGRTDAEAELGGPHEVIQLEEMSSLLRRSRRSSTRFGRRNALRSEVEPIVAEGQVFQVFITGGERIEQE